MILRGKTRGVLQKGMGEEGSWRCCDYILVENTTFLKGSRAKREEVE